MSAYRPRPPQGLRSIFPSERQVFAALDRYERELRRAGESLLGRIFGLNPTGGSIRWAGLTLFFAAAWAVFAYIYSPPSWPEMTSNAVLAYPLRALFVPRILWVVAFAALIAYQTSRYALSSMGRGGERMASLLALVVILGVAFLWAMLAYRRMPPPWGSDFSRQVIEYPFQALFAAPVFRHVLLAGLVFWVAYRVAALYLDDVFELQSISIAQSFINQAAFAIQYRAINIRDGSVAEEDRNSPVALIGGPGYARVFVENAALFEKVGGRPHVIGPTGERAWGIALIDGFERLRTVIDLRSHTMEITVQGRTRDGIQVSARNVRFLFSVYRGPGVPVETRPYPFTRRAVRRLVYRGAGGQPWEATMANQVRRALGSFIAQHTLSQFLALVSYPELEERIQQEAQLFDEPVDLNVPPDASFVEREEISDLFDEFAAQFQDAARDQGVSLEWVGIGTWVTPSEIVPERQVRAWLLTRENQIRSSPAALERLRQESRTEALLSLIRTDLLDNFHEWTQDGADPSRVICRMLQVYYSKLDITRDLYEQGGNQPLSADEIALGRAIEELGNYLRLNCEGDANE